MSPALRDAEAPSLTRWTSEVVVHESLNRAGAYVTIYKLADTRSYMQRYDTVKVEITGQSNSDPQWVVGYVMRKDGWVPVAEFKFDSEGGYPIEDVADGMVEILKRIIG